jgi:hypothetical protein
MNRLEARLSALEAARRQRSGMQVVVVKGGLSDPTEAEIDAAVRRAEAAGERLVVVGGLPE